MHVPVSGTDAKVDIVDVVMKTSSSRLTTGTLAVTDSRDFVVRSELASVQGFKSTSDSLDPK
jgi:hypothetical protein